jgi:ankyrin repeat protein
MHCSSFIRLSSCGEYFELAHFTVKEFLAEVSTSIPSLAIYSQNKSEVFPYLAKTCLTYILLHDFQGEVIEDYHAWEEQRSQYPFREYAVEDWIAYAEHAWDNDVFKSYVQTLFHPGSKTYHFLSWTRDYRYVHSDAFDLGYYVDHCEKAFIEATKFICEGGVTPLHIASAIGNLELCRWLIGLGCAIDQTSSLGSPVHCALLGIRPLRYCTDEDSWLYRISDDEKHDRLEVLDLLIRFNADLSLRYMAVNGKGYSCAKLALCFGSAQGTAEHPLVQLITAGVQLDSSLLNSFQEFFKKRPTISTSDSKGKSSGQELIAALVPILNEVSQDGPGWSDLLNILQLQDSTDASEPMDIENLEIMLDRAIRFDRKEEVERLLRETRFAVSTSYGKLEETALHRAAKSESFHTMKFLLSLRLDIDATTTAGLTPLHYAAGTTSRTGAVIELLLEHGASTTATERDSGKTVWHFAADSENVIGLKTLLALEKEGSNTLLLPDCQGM